jgi:hypothetical protein
MSLTGGKRKVNKSLKAWVAFVKKVQKEEKLSYKDAIHRAKQRKDKGEKWMTGGQTPSTGALEAAADMFNNNANADEDAAVVDEGDAVAMDIDAEANKAAADVSQDAAMDVDDMNGGRRKRRTMRRSRGRGRGRGRTARRARGRASRRH